MKLLRNLFVLFMGVWALLVFTGCETTDGGTAAAIREAQAAAAGQPIAEDKTKIRVGEQLTIELLDITPPSKIEQAVADDGTITLPLLQDRVKASGKVDTELAAEIHDLYVTRYYKRMTVNIKREHRYYFVRGYVKNPRQRIYTGDMTVMRAITSAGDFNEYGKKKDINVIRSNGRVEKVNGDKAIKDPKKYDLPIYPGDTVYVPLKVW